MNAVIVFRSTLFSRSETFVKEQIQAMKGWNPILVGYRTETGMLPRDGVRLVFRGSPNRFQLLRLHVCQLFRIAHRPTVRMLRRIKARIVHVHFGTDAVHLWPSVRKLGIPMIVTLHGLDITTNREWWEKGHGGWWRRRYPKQLLDLSNERSVHFVAVSEVIQARAIAFGIPANKISVRYTGVDTSRFRRGSVSITAVPKRILFVGRLVEVKGVEYLIKAFAQVHAEVAEAELVIVGDGPDREHLSHLSKSLEISAEFLGGLSSQQVREQMLQARVLCLPSITTKKGNLEGFGTVLLEAQACGLPVVSSAAGGASEGLLDTRTGFRFVEKDVEGLAARLKQILLNDKLCSGMSASATEFVRHNFDIRNCSRALEEIYDSMV